MRKLWAVALVAALGFGAGWFAKTLDVPDAPVRVQGAAPADTPENRLAAAKKYFQIMPLKDQIAEIARETAKSLPVNEQAHFIGVMTKDIRADVLEEASIKIMAKHFTTAEIGAMTAFYEAPEGRAVMKKMGPYMGDVMQVVQTEIARVTQVGK